MSIKHTLTIAAATLAVGLVTAIGQPLVTLPIQVKFTAHGQDDLVERANSASAKIEKVRITNREILEALDVSPTSQLAIVVHRDGSKRVMAGSTDVTAAVGSLFPLGAIEVTDLNADLDLEDLIDQMNDQGAVLQLTAKGGARSSSATITVLTTAPVSSVLPNQSEGAISVQGINLINATVKGKASSTGVSASWSQSGTLTGTFRDSWHQRGVLTGTWTAKGSASWQ